MPLNKLDNFIKNTEGRILYVNPNDLDSTDSIENQGNSLARPFKTVQRALLEAARFSYVAGDNNDLVEKTTILLFPGEHLIDNRPGYAVYNSSGAKAVDRAGGQTDAANVFSLLLDSNFDLTQEDNILYKFNSWYGGVIVPRGTSIVGLDLRKTKIRPKYVPNPTDDTVSKSAIFRITGACYFWQFSLFDADASSIVYTNPNDYSSIYRSTPNFSHHKVTCFEFCDGVNKITLPIGGGSGTETGLTDLDMYYSKVSNAYNAFRSIKSEDKYPTNPLGFAKRDPEFQIVGAFATDPITISSIFAGNGSVADARVTVTTATEHGLNVGTPIKIKGVGVGVYNVSTTVQTILSSTSFTYLLSSVPTIPSPGAAGATVTVETDTVSGASPYIFNCSLRSVWGMNGLHADGSKASGFRSTVVAQFTAVSLQKDDRAFAKYNKSSRSYEKIDYTAVSGADLPNGASQTDTTRVYHLDPDAIYRQGWETSHIKITNDAFIQIVSVFAIGFNKHFDAETGGDGSITNSNSNFGQISLNSSGFKKEAFDKDNKAFITSIVTPRSVSSNEDNIEWLSLNVGLTTQVGISSHLYLYGFNSINIPPSSLTQGYRIGARQNDKLYVTLGTGTSEANIHMCNNAISATGLTTALGTTNSVKFYDATTTPATGFTTSFTIGANELITGEKVTIISDDGDLPENIDPNQIYYAINAGDNNTVKLASSYTNALQNKPIQVVGGTNLHILSRVSDKESGELGSPVQFDAQNNNWFIHVNTNNQIYNAIGIGGTQTFGPTTDLAYVKRISDERSIDEKLYKLRVIIPKEFSNAKDPETGFIIQESSTTGVRTDTDFTRTSIASTDYAYLKNLRLISSCTESLNTVTVITELPHNLQVGEIVTIKNVRSSTNSTGSFNSGYNGRFTVTSISNANTFSYTTTNINTNITQSAGTFTDTTSTRDQNLPRFERNDWQSNLFVYRNEIISPYIFNQQDGIYHLYVLNSSNAISANIFTNLKYGQLPVDLYPQLDRDNVNDNPQAAKTFAKRAPIGAVETNDLKKSITRETTDLALKNVGIALTISSVTSTSGIATLTFSRFHGLSGIVTGSITPGASYTDGTYYNVKLLNGSQTGSWSGATAKVVVTGGAVVGADIISSGSGYAASALYFDQTAIGAGNGNARYTITTAGISTNIGDVVQITGAGTTSDGYYRIISIGSSTSIAIAKTAGDPTLQSGQYAFVVNSSIRISGTTYDSSSGITTFTTYSSHGLLSGNRFRIIDLNNNNLGDYIVDKKVSVTSFTALTNASISATNGYVLKHGLSANNGISDKNGENFGIRNVSFYNNQTFTLTSAITTGNTINISQSGIGTAQRLPLGSYIQIDNEIMRVISSDNNTSATVIRGALGTVQENHDLNSLIRKINPIAIEFRRPSILRASGHTFEYLGYGPGNYSTGLPQVQVKTLNDQENFLANSQERSGGVVVYTGMNNSGDFYNGNTKTSAASGEIISYDIPKPTVTGENPNRLSVVFDEVTIKERLLVEGGASGQVLSQFDGPVTFNKEIRAKSQATFNNTVRLTQGAESISSTTGDLIISGGVGIGNNINIGGNTSIGTMLFVTNATQLSSHLSVAGVTTFTNRLIVSGSSTNDLVTINQSGSGLGLFVNGKVGVIGLTTVTGNVNVTGDLTVTNSDVYITNGIGTGGNVYVNGGTDGVFEIYNTTTSGQVNLNIKNASGAYVRILDLSSSSVRIDGALDVTGDITAFWTPSDKNLKDNITRISNPLDKILSISGNTFTWKEGNSNQGEDTGVIAQEIEELELPGIVKTHEDGHKSVQYHKIIPVLIEAIRELKVEIDELKKSINN